jgi:hypothetical protein
VSEYASDTWRRSTWTVVRWHFSALEIAALVPAAVLITMARWCVSVARMLWGFTCGPIYIGGVWAKRASASHAGIGTQPHRLYRHPSLRQPVRDGYTLAAQLHATPAAPSAPTLGNRTSTARTREHVPVRSRSGRRP